MKGKRARRAAPRRLIVGMTGATGSIYGLRLLESLRALGGWETHLVVSDAGMLNVWQEYRLARKDIVKLADVVHNVGFRCGIDTRQSKPIASRAVLLCAE